MEAFVVPVMWMAKESETYCATATVAMSGKSSGARTLNEAMFKAEILKGVLGDN